MSSLRPPFDKLWVSGLGPFVASQLKRERTHSATIAAA